MLRTIRRKLVLGRLPLTKAPASTSAATAHALHAPAVHEEPYGQEYGAGPSRLPYQYTPVPTPSINSPRNRREAARLARSTLASDQVAGYGQPTAFSDHLRELNLPPIVQMSRLELHATVHHLLRTGRSTLALGIITRAIDAGASSHPQLRQIFSQRTLKSLLRAESQQLDTLTRNQSGTSRRTAAKLNALLDLLRALQSIRHHRPMQLYTLLVQMSIHQRRPDKAAEIFVGLVEEWVTEGRIAEGADADSFYEGGGPPRLLREDMAKKHKSWWTGVRTWTLPGEVLSPHDRLDLWHPTKLSLGGKFKNFLYPLATSPPSMVPPPSSQLLNPILSALRLDPKVAAPADFEASMRACAILANTVLSRTLPLSSLGPLLRALEATPSHPPVYPANLHPIPKTDAWAYEAFTQIHLALQSFLFSPPISAASFAMARANETILSGTPLTTHADKYRLQPLALGDAVILLRYALEKMRSTKVLEKLVRYVKRTFNFGWSKPVVWNAVLGGATLLGDKQLARVADDALFGETVLSRTETVEGRDDRSPQSGRAEGEGRWVTARQQSPIPATSLTAGGTDAASDGQTPEEGNARSTSVERVKSYQQRVALRRQTPPPASPELIALLTPTPEAKANVQADEQSLVLLIHHLGKTSQFDRLTHLVYRLIPFLNSDPANPASDETQPTSGRIKPNPLTPQLYTAILSSLALAGRTGLAQRVYSLAMDAEKMWIGDYFESHPSADPAHVPQALKLPVPLFTAMLRVWGNEVHGTVLLAEREKRPEGTTTDIYPVGWVPPKYLAGQPRWIAAGLMARAVYKAAAARFPPPQTTNHSISLFPTTESPSGADTPSLSSYTPDALFFDQALRAFAHHFDFLHPTPHLGPTRRARLGRIIEDMRLYNVPVPPRVVERYMAKLGERGEGEGGEVRRLAPREYRVFVPAIGRKERERRGVKLRGLAEALVRAEEEGLWRDGGVRATGEEGGGERREAEVEGLVLLQARG